MSISKNKQKTQTNGPVCVRSCPDDIKSQVSRLLGIWDQRQVFDPFVLQTIKNTIVNIRPSLPECTSPILSSQDVSHIERLANFYEYINKACQKDRQLVADISLHPGLMKYISTGDSAGLGFSAEDRKAFKSLLTSLEGRLTAQVEDHRAFIKVLYEAIETEQSLLASSIRNVKDLQERITGLE